VLRLLPLDASPLARKQCVVLLRLREALQPFLEAKNIAGFSDGSALVYSLKDDDSLDVLSEWKEPRLKETKFIGLSLSSTSVRLLPTYY
jgi:hypothetical protein